MWGTSCWRGKLCHYRFFTESQADLLHSASAKDPRSPCHRVTFLKVERVNTPGLLSQFQPNPHPSPHTHPRAVRARSGPAALSERGASLRSGRRNPPGRLSLAPSSSGGGGISIFFTKSRGAVPRDLDGRKEGRKEKRAELDWPEEGSERERALWTDWHQSSTQDQRKCSDNKLY